jgi:hypothetical protein
MTGEYFIEIVNNSDINVNLGMMRKAICVKKTLKGNFIISQSSFFPFTESVYAERFSSKEDALTYAIEYFRKWFSETTEYFLEYDDVVEKKKLNNNYLLE